MRNLLFLFCIVFIIFFPINLIAEQDDVTKFHSMAFEGNIDSMEVMLKNGTNINAQNNFGNTALHFAIPEGRVKTVEFLLKNGADINLSNNKKETPLINAAYYGKTDIVKVLLDNKSNVDLCDENGKTACKYALENNFKDIFKLLYTKMEFKAIDGAYGMKLGERVNPRKTNRSKRTSTGIPLFYFEPSEKFRKFNQYYVVITPKTHLVSEIWAIAKIKDEKEFLNEEKSVLNILEKKYGPSIGIDINSSIAVKHVKYGKVISNGDKIIKMGYSNDIIDGNSYYIQFIDASLQKKAEKEYSEMRFEKQFKYEGGRVY